MSFAENLQAAMTRSGVSRSQLKSGLVRLGATSGTAAMQVSTWLAGKTANPQPQTIAKLAKLLRIKPEELAGNGAAATKAPVVKTKAAPTKRKARARSNKNNGRAAVAQTGVITLEDSAVDRLAKACTAMLTSTSRIVSLDVASVNRVAKACTALPIALNGESIHMLAQRVAAEVRDLVSQLSGSTPASASHQAISVMERVIAGMEQRLQRLDEQMTYLAAAGLQQRITKLEEAMASSELPSAPRTG